MNEQGDSVLTPPQQSVITPPPTSPEVPSDPTFLPPHFRILLFILGLLLAAGFALARSLEPSPQGFGTHQQLGLPPCTIRFLFGLPCPSCGMTTSFSWLTRGQLIESVRANAAGTLLGIQSCIVMILSWKWSIRGQCPPRRTLESVVLINLLIFVGAAVVLWLVRIQQMF